MFMGLPITLNTFKLSQYSSSFTPRLVTPHPPNWAYYRIGAITDYDDFCTSVFTDIRCLGNCRLIPEFSQEFSCLCYHVICVEYYRDHPLFFLCMEYSWWSTISSRLAEVFNRMIWLIQDTLRFGCCIHLELVQNYGRWRMHWKRRMYGNLFTLRSL